MLKVLFILLITLQFIEGYYLKKLSCLNGHNITKIGSYEFGAIDRYNSETECITIKMFCQGHNTDENLRSSTFCLRR